MRTYDPGDRNERLFAIFRFLADIERTGRRIGPDHEKIVARLEALMTGAGREDRNIACFQKQRAAFRSAELDLSAAARDAEHFVDARVVVKSIVVDAVAP